MARSSSSSHHTGNHDAAETRDRDRKRGPGDPQGHQGHGHHGHAHHGHGHHGHGHAEAPTHRLAIALALTTLYFFIELIAGFQYGSLALLSDAGHMFSDIAALGLALGAHRLAERPRTRERTFGFRRAETLAAFINAGALLATAFFVIVEALRRVGEPREIEGGGMTLVAVIGLGINIASALVLAGGQSSLNVRAAMAHVLSDAAGSVAAIVSGILIILYGWTWADPVCSILISLLVGYSAWSLARNASAVLMEGTPPNIDVSELERTILECKGVRTLHDLHVWQIEEGFEVAMVHVVLEPGFHGVEVARRVGLAIQRDHDLDHVTVQPEADSEPRLIPVSALTRHRIPAASDLRQRDPTP